MKKMWVFDQSSGGTKISDEVKGKVKTKLLSVVKSKFTEDTKLHIQKNCKSQIATEIITSTTTI